MNLPAIDIVTVSYKNAEYFPAYLEALRRLDYPYDLLRLILVDNASADGAVPLLREQLPSMPFASELIECGKNLGFSGGCNRGASLGTGDYILFLNPDTEAEPDMLMKLSERALSEPNAGLVEAAQYPNELSKWFDPDTNETDWCSGGSVLAKRSAFDGIGGFDTIFYPAYCEDVDLSWRMWLTGWRCVYEPAARVKHETLMQDGTSKPVENYYSIKFSFAMHFIYDSLGGLLKHIVRGLRYFASPKTNKLTRRAVKDGLIMIVRHFFSLMKRRRKIQATIVNCANRDRFVFTEWYYGRWFTN